MKQSLQRVMPHVFDHEGGYVDHPSDPGGATNMGITQATLSAWRGKKVTKAEVKALTQDEATEIYRSQYWNHIHGDELPTGVDYAVFDFAINSGVRRASEYLQRVVGAEADGHIGAMTLQAVKAMHPDDIIKKLTANRLTFLKRIKNRKTGKLLWDDFGRGWKVRVDGVANVARTMAAEGGTMVLAVKTPDMPKVASRRVPEPEEQASKASGIIGLVFAAVVIIGGIAFVILH